MPCWIRAWCSSCGADIPVRLSVKMLFANVSRGYDAGWKKFHSAIVWQGYAQNGVILSAASASRSEADAESKDPYQRRSRWMLKGVLTRLLSGNSLRAHCQASEHGVLRLRGRSLCERSLRPLRSG